jgi:ubiquinone/menaquinone biosynthesis C-methylase UbiE
MNPMGVSDNFYLDLAGPAPKRVIDFGCGTGALASAFVERGHNVTGVDPAPAMLNLGKTQKNGGSVRWIEADMRGFRLDQMVDFIVMTGHAFQVFLTDADVDAALATMRAHLAEDGTVNFESRNPLVREWDTWSLPRAADKVDVPDIGPVEITYEIESENGELMGFASCYKFLKAGDEIVTHSVLRFMPQEKLAEALEKAGLRPIAWYGDWDKSPYARTSREIIVTAKRL